MNAEALALAEPDDGSAGARHVARRILAAAFLAFALILVLGGRARADVLDPAQTATDAAGQAVATAPDVVDPVLGSAAETVDQAVETSTDAVEPIVETATDAVDPIVGTAKNVVDVLEPVRRATQTVLPGTKGAVGQDPATPRPPIPDGTPPNPAPHAHPSRFSTDWLARTAGAGSTAAPPSLVLPGTHATGAPSGATPPHGGGSLPLGPFGDGPARGPLTLLVLIGALVVSLTVRPPPIRSPLAPTIVAPNGAALALSVERPG